MLLSKVPNDTKISASFSRLFPSTILIWIVKKKILVLAFMFQIFYDVLNSAPETATFNYTCVCSLLKNLVTICTLIIDFCLTHIVFVRIFMHPKLRGTDRYCAWEISASDFKQIQNGFTKRLHLFCRSSALRSFSVFCRQPNGINRNSQELWNLQNGLYAILFSLLVFITGKVSMVSKGSQEGMRREHIGF